MNQHIDAVNAFCPPVLAQAVLPLMAQADFTASFSADNIAQLQQQTGLNAESLAIALLPLAASYAITPISQFKVGAIAQGASGRWYLGANMEFAQVPLQQTVHAEQSAITHAWMCNEPQLTAVTVNYTPCGHCRQFMNELNSAAQLTIHLPEHPPQPLHYYLPNAFGPTDLGITQCLFDPQPQHFSAEADPLVNAAIQAANQSYAPYSQAFSGVALRMRQGNIISGRYAENAAYNPSLPPLQAALIMVNLQGYRIDDIEQAVLAELATPQLSQQTMTQATLAAFAGKPTLRIVTLAE